MKTHHNIVRIPSVGELLHFKSMIHDVIVIVSSISEDGRFNGFAISNGKLEDQSGCIISKNNEKFWHKLS